MLLAQMMKIGGKAGDIVGAHMMKEKAAFLLVAVKLESIQEQTVTRGKEASS